MSKAAKDLHFDVSTGLKRVLGRELITDDEVAVFELVKNSFDAGAKEVAIYFGQDNVVVADNGVGMSYEDLTQKWLFVAYSSKRRERPSQDFRNVAAERHYAGSKGIGRFSSDRLGSKLVVQSRSTKGRGQIVHSLAIDWARFERSETEHFENVPVAYSQKRAFDAPSELKKFVSSLTHGTIIEIRNLRRTWTRQRILALKEALAKLINPFGERVDDFNIRICAPAEDAKDKEIKRQAKIAGEEVLSRDLVNGVVGNFIFSTLRDKTTFIKVEIRNEKIQTSLTDRGELIYEILEPNPFPDLADSGFKCELYYLNQSAKLTFARRVGLPSVQFGSLFLFRNNFRVFPIGEDGDDWFGFNRRKQQGYARFLGTREIIGRVDVYGSDEDFQEASSRNQGLIETPAVQQLRRAVLDYCLRRLEKYVVPVSWADKADANTEDLSRLLTDPGRARVSAAVAALVDSDDVELVAYSTRLVDLLNERSSEFEASIGSLRAIAEKTKDKGLALRIDSAERRFEELKKSEAEARKVADRALREAQASATRAEAAEANASFQQRRAHFLESAVSIDTATILNLHHQVTIYAVDIAQQIENFLVQTAGKNSVPREVVLKALEQMAFLNRKVLAVTRFASQANFKLDSEKIEADLPAFIAEYIQQIAKNAGGARLSVEVNNEHPGFKARFKPIDAAIVVDNLISNARKARATKIQFEISSMRGGGVQIRVADNGRGLAAGVDRAQIFGMGYTATQGSGLGLYHVRQVLGEMGGSIEVDNHDDPRGLALLIKIAAKGKSG